MRAAFLFAIGSICGPLLAGCEPCAGVIGCVGASHLEIHGRVLEETTALPATNSVVDFIRTGGVLLERDSIRAVVDAEGLFVIASHAQGDGEVVGDVVVRVGDGAAYRVPGVRARANRRRGDAVVLPPWSTAPRFTYVAQVFRRGYPREILAGVTVEVRRTGGVQVTGMPDGVWTTTSDGNGVVSIFGGAVVPSEAGDLIADVVIRDAAGTILGTHRGVAFTASPVFRAAAELRTLGVGPNLEYHLAVLDRGRFGTPVPGVLVQFERTSGIDVEPSNWEMRTDAGGRVVFPVRAQAAGILRGTVRVIPPAPWKSYELPDLEFPTYDQDGAILYRVLGVGPGLPYYGIIRRQGAGLGGVSVEFEQTGGIPISPARFTSVSNDTGLVTFTPDPEIEGEVIANLIIRPPPPYAAFTVRGLRLLALDAERPHVLLGEWDVATPPASFHLP